MIKSWKLIIGLCLFLVSCSLFLAPAGALGGNPPEVKADSSSASGPVGGKYIIDDFESGSISSPREWWIFDIEKAEAVSNADLKMGDVEVAGTVGQYSFLLNGKANNWYSGGGGVYLAKENMDLSGYNALAVDVFGRGPNSGSIKFELFDDDNNNWQVEQDPAKNYAPIYDDKLTYNLKVDWRGWKHVIVPFDDFVDDNDGVGDDIWNPAQANGSGGLLQIQLICLATKDDGIVNVNLDNISFIVSEE
ncbi:MAG: hypothetical protein ABIE84_00915 [bacterium]